MNKWLICFQIILICLFIGCSDARMTNFGPVAKPAFPTGAGTAINFGTAQSAGGIQGRRKRWFGPGFGWGGWGFGGVGPGSALNFGVAQSAGGIQGKRKRFAFNFGTAQSAGGIQG
ncbi:unnamed protein product [Brachionus calyciflorus]|uniref:Uncharacterized protein n=1 Tax=Brachionus calyciflorus TaxID=104777 RepID=A0A814JA99_9BILA|nr:unnamed protein product [Brachionus calyciflorus]